MREALFHTTCMKSGIIGYWSRKVQVYRDYMHHNHTEYLLVATVMHWSILSIEFTPIIIPYTCATHAFWGGTLILLWHNNRRRSRPVCTHPLVKWAWLSVTYCYHSRIVSPMYGGTVYSGLEPMMGMLLSRTSLRLYHQTGPGRYTTKISSVVRSVLP